MSHIHKILVPMDGSLPSIAALSEAVMLAEDLGASIEVLHIEAPDAFEVGSSTAVAEEAEEEADREMVGAVVAAKGRLGERLTETTKAGDPLHEILEVAADRADLIVMGTHGRIGRLHSLLGSVAEGVVRSSTCPVLTVRRPDGGEESFSERIHRRRSISDQTRPTR